LPESTSNLPSRHDFDALVKLANGGDEQALTKLREMLDTNPQIWRSIGNLAQHAQAALIRTIANGNQLITESLQRKADELRGELTGASPTALERLAIERVVATYLELQFVDAKHPADAGQNLPMARYLVQLKLGAQKRFDSSMKILLLIREKQPAIERANRDLARHKKRIIRLPTRAAS